MQGIMLIERVIYPISTLGPGERIVIWTSGCSKKCHNCISQEMLLPKPEKDVPMSQLIDFIMKIIKENNVDGITISGGDPLEQPDELLELVSAVNSVCSDILVYTGYTLNELCQILPPLKMQSLKNHIAVLIDGRYIDELNDNATPLIGSINQKIHYFDSDLKPRYETYMQAEIRRIQNVFYRNNIISVGIFNREGMHGKSK